MLDQVTIDLSTHRLDKAKEALKQAELLFDNGGYDGSVNRSYYAIFNAIRALLALVNLDSRRHSGVISFFDRYFVKTGIFDKSFSHIVHSAFDVRQMSDYEDYAAPTPEQAKRQVENAVRLICEVERQRTLLLQGKIPLPAVSSN
ncbi:putative toxin-antitoxin system, antitoxin component [Candidatus Vecturithrix granuli]|uniref:Putative toxin-antitoxin system, antitoxin component n=1 Tax=Vecturithrix granuli TaxID=1499967 RepID=A0A081BXM1_VECG1|nr:putative toxin-antitoxin system, antitoxin component [Candidatus Vecturithrix granuli]